jgi:hypothetical protein
LKLDPDAALEELAGFEIGVQTLQSESRLALDK